MSNELKTIVCVNPATGERFGEVAMATNDQIVAARREMAAAAPIWAAKAVEERVRILRKLQEVMVDSLDEITEAMNQDNGKSRHDALIETLAALNKLRVYLKKAPSWLKRRKVPTSIYLFRKYYVDPIPYGVVSIIAPWNYPFLLLVPATCSALLAGNTVLVKPSEVTPTIGVLIEKLFKRVPELAPFVRFLHGDAQVGEAMVNTRPDLIFLTGSTKTGRIVANAAAESMIPFYCELGGKDPMIVLEDADIEAAAKWCVWGGATFNSGQSCVAVERIYVVDEAYDQFLQAIIEEAKQIRLGYSSEKDSPFELAPLTFERQIDIIDEHLNDAVAKGAKIAYGGQRDGLFMEPVVLVDVDHSMKIMWEETFGPILPIMRVDDEQHAIQLANHSKFGLNAYVWSQNIPRAERIAEQLEVGSVLINDVMFQWFNPLQPFGGVKLSGNARTHGREEIMQFTQSRAYTVGRPPYSFDLWTLLRYPQRYRELRVVAHLLTGVNPEQKIRPILEMLEVKEGNSKVGKTAQAAGAVAAVAALGLALFKAKKS
jgi:acyl-CoA reductase-like NAD-dependent aldehyde dehydrogenase